ncbi:MAG TPA: amino acid adenylation domain-containing protein [Nodularia sp. (in: cyanobacteria)]|nr:amino acid adenylation domain-containing protein [Nodularia sp. (in: cyanobacteria)]
MTLHTFNNQETEVYVFPASFGQKRLWFLDQLEPGSPFYNLPYAVRLTGSLNITLLEKSFQAIIQRHEALRTSIITVDGEPVQAINPSVNLAIRVINLEYLPENQREIEAQKIAIEEAKRPFILSECPLLRLNLLQLNKENYILLLTIHHAIFDGWSIGILLKELSLIYKAFSDGQTSKLPDLQLQYADYSVWQQEYLQGEVLDKQLSYWKQQLDGISTLQLPTDRSRSALQTFEGKTYSWQIPQDLTTALEIFSQKAGVTLFMTLLTAFNTLLYRYTSQDDIIVGSAIANRNWAENEGIIGLFINTLILRTQIKNNQSFSELLTQVRDTTLKAYAHQDLPFEKLVEEIQPERDLSRNPLFQVWFALHNFPIPTLQIGDLTLTPIEVERGTTQFDLSLDIYIGEQGLKGAIEYSTELFEAETIARIAQHFQTLLEGIIANPLAKLSELPLLTPADKHQLLFEWNNTQTNWEEFGSVHQVFAEQVVKTPDAIAVVFGQQQLTYAQLNKKANQLANYLQHLGVKPEVLVGICVERSMEMIVGILGILKAGGAYVPIDPSYPQERLELMLEDAQVSVLITQKQLIAKLPNHNAKIICLDDDDWQLQTDKYDQNPISNTTPENLAYVIYTSGSTGKPKGVMIEHKSLSNFTQTAIKEYEIKSSDHILQFASISFDTAIEEIFPCLLTGATLVIRSDEMIGSIPDFLEKCRQYSVSVLDLPTAFWHQLTLGLSTQSLVLPETVRLVIIGGETALPQQVLNWHQRVDPQKVRLVNSYGPTETTVVATVCELSTITQIKREVPIGKAISNYQTYILDSYLQPVPIGVTGELHIGGIGLAREYLNYPELTAAKFISHPFSNQLGAKLYKTGDLARYLPNGEIEYLGRIDNQVKIRGFRIELAEIETVLACYPKVKENVVIVREDEPSKKRLVAYVVPIKKSNLSTQELRQLIKQKLPNYMVPSAFVILDALPTTPNGKLDRRSLPIPEINRPKITADFVTEQNPVEAQLVQIWTEVLNVKHIGIYDNFFDLGGDSILSIQVVAKANQKGLQLTPKQLFQNQTIAELAMVVGTTITIEAEQGLVTGDLALIPIQHWFFKEKFSQPHHYNQANLLIVKDSLNPEYLQQVLQQLIVHHDALRIQFTKTASGWQQLNTSADITGELIQFNLSKLSTIEQESQITALAEQLQASLNLGKASLMKVALFNLGKDKPNRLLFIIHHLIIDGVSWRILLEDFQTAYTQLSQGQAIKLPAKTTAYKQWAQRLVNYAKSPQIEQELDYWLTESQKKIACLPVDFNNGVNIVESAGKVSIALSESETQALLHDIPSAYRTQINEVLLTALSQTFTNWTGENSLLIDLEGHGREPLFSDVDLSRTVGWFTSVFPVYLNWDKTGDLIQILKAVKEQLRLIPNQGIGYGLLRYLGREEIIKKLSNVPQAEVSFNYLGQFNQVSNQSEFLALASESIGSVHSPQARRSYLMEIDCLVINNRLQIDWTYSQKSHRQSTVENLAQGFIKALQSLINRSQAPDTGSYTPSDFASAKIGQKDFKKLLDKLNHKGSK